MTSARPSVGSQSTIQAYISSQTERSRSYCAPAAVRTMSSYEGASQPSTAREKNSKISGLPSKSISAWVVPFVSRGMQRSASPGMGVGVGVGSAVGSGVGSAVGAAVGSGVGASVGAAASAVGAGVASAGVLPFAQPNSISAASKIEAAISILFI